MKIHKKLLLNFGILLALMLMGFLFSLGVAFRERQTRAAVTKAYAQSLITESIRHQMAQNRLALSNYILTGADTDLDRLQQGNAHTIELLHQAQANTTDADLRAGLKRIEKNEQEWSSTFAAVFVQGRKDFVSGKIKLADFIEEYRLSDWAQQDKQANEVIDGVQTADRALIQKTRQSDELVSRWATAIDLVGLLITLSAGIFIAARTAASITEPLNHISVVAREISEKGDLDHEIDIEGTDEIGTLSKALHNMVVYFREMSGIAEAMAAGNLAVEVMPRSNRDTLNTSFSQMATGLRRLVGSVRDAAAQVSAGSNQVADASEDTARNNVQSAAAIDEVTSTMHEMSINVQNMVKSTQMQASSVSETSASIDQMVASIQRVADSAKVLLDISAKSRDEVTNGIDTMQKTTDGLNRINASIVTSASIIASLGERVDNIGKIVEVIDDISEQTNLLALNAAIEAARAGEHGLGFAVVADEVRKLAEKSANSTREISELIGSIQAEARGAVNNMEKSTSIVNEGLELGNNLNLALRKISNVVTEVFNYSREIGGATNEQSNGSSQIAMSTARLNEITHEISSAVEEQAGGAQAVVRAMERMREMVQQSSSSSTELAASAEQMSKMARSLLQQMDRFVLEDHHEEQARRLSGSKYALAGTQS